DGRPPSPAAATRPSLVQSTANPGHPRPEPWPPVRRKYEDDSPRRPMWSPRRRSIMGPTMSALTIPVAAHRRSGAPVAAWLLAVPLGGVLGVVLGWWCRRSAGELSVSGVLAEMGAPWILAAFV